MFVFKWVSGICCSYILDCSTRIQGLNKEHNIHTSAGLVILGELMVQCKPNALLWLSPTCSTWIWPSRGSTLRGLVPRLNEFWNSQVCALVYTSLPSFI